MFIIVHDLYNQYLLNNYFVKLSITFKHSTINTSKIFTHLSAEGNLLDVVEQLVQSTTNLSCRLAQFFEQVFVLTALVTNLYKTLDWSGYLLHCGYQLLLACRAVQCRSHHLDIWEDQYIVCPYKSTCYYWTSA